MEYGGMDVGYSTVTLNYLGYMHADGSFRVENQLNTLGSMLADFITPGGYLGGEFASRSTTYFLPFGFMQAAYQNKENASHFAPLNLSSAYTRLDDRYLMHYCLPALAMGALALAKAGEPKQTKQSSSKDWLTKAYPQVQLYALRRQDSAVFLGLNKGGALQIEHEGKHFVDTGYRLTRDGNTFATCVLQEEVPIDVGETDTGVEFNIEAQFLRYGALTASPLKTIALRILSFFGPALNTLFKRILIQAPRSLPDVFLQRRIRLDTTTNELHVEDKLEGLQEGDELTLAPASSFRLVPSAKFHQPGEEDALSASLVPLEGKAFSQTFDLN